MYNKIRSQIKSYNDFINKIIYYVYNPKRNQLKPAFKDDPTVIKFLKDKYFEINSLVKYLKFEDYYLRYVKGPINKTFFKIVNVDIDKSELSDYFSDNYTNYRLSENIFNELCNITVSLDHFLTRQTFSKLDDFFIDRFYSLDNDLLRLYNHSKDVMDFEATNNEYKILFNKFMQKLLRKNRNYHDIYKILIENVGAYKDKIDSCNDTTKLDFNNIDAPFKKKIEGLNFDKKEEIFSLINNMKSVYLSYFKYRKEYENYLYSKLKKRYERFIKGLGLEHDKSYDITI